MNDDPEQELPGELYTDMISALKEYLERTGDLSIFEVEGEKEQAEADSAIKEAS